MTMYNLVPRYWNNNIEDKNQSIWDNLKQNFDDMFMDTTYYSDNGELVYELEVPGFNKDNLSIDMDNGVITISGDRKLDTHKNHVGNKKIYKRISVESTDVNAEIKDGILYITIRKPKTNVKNIELK
jgi:HSP20 family protein